jgi:hypothetical protein
MRKALDYGLNMKQDRAMATLIWLLQHFQKGRKAEAQRLLEEAKIRFCRNDDRSNKNDERPIENAFYAKTHA